MIVISEIEEKKIESSFVCSYLNKGHILSVLEKNEQRSVDKELCWRTVLQKNRFYQVFMWTKIKIFAAKSRIKRYLK